MRTKISFYLIKLVFNFDEKIAKISYSKNEKDTSRLFFLKNSRPKTDQKNRKNLKEFGIWDNQINLYQKMENRLTKNQITEVVSALDDADKKVKGVLPGNPWLTAREAVKLLSF